MFKRILLTFFVILTMAGAAFAAHPLITDDTGTQGKGKFQLEVNSEFDHEDEDGTKEDIFEIAPVLSYGITDNVDLVIGVPYQSIRTREQSETFTESGISDTSFEVKWRFYEKDGLSFALKPGISLPTGDEDKGLGAGRAGYSIFIITTKEIEPWAFHLNLGYIRNENKADERKNLWHASLSGSVEAKKDLSLVANIGIERNADRNVNTHPAFILGGIIYSLSENLDIDFGLKAGLNKPERDYSVLAGLAWRF
jgi:hypothetical protein